MEKNLYIDASHPNETRVVLKTGDNIEDYEYEGLKNNLIKNNIYLGKVSRVEPSLQAAFIDFGRDRHGFLSFNDIQSDYYQIPQNDLIIQGGQFYSKIDLFDSTSLNDNDELLQLRNKNWLINEASLVFYVDPNQPLQNANNVYPERLYLYNLESGLPINDFLIDNTINTLSTNAGKKVFGGLLEYDSDDKPWRYKFRITDHLNKIIRKDSVNSSLALISGANISALSIKKALNSSDEPIKLPATGILNPFGVKLVGSHPEEPLKDKKIELEIYYTKY